MKVLQDAMRDHFSPEAIALMIANLQGVRSSNCPGADGEVRWFVEQMTNLAGGAECVNRLFDEVGV
jgi:hypothetical protein